MYTTEQWSTLFISKAEYCELDIGNCCDRVLQRLTLHLQLHAYEGDKEYDVNTDHVLCANRTDSRETMHGYATIDPLYAQGKRSFRSPELVVARSYRSWNPPKPSPVLHRNSRSDHWLLRAYGNSQRAVSASPPTRGDPDARPPYGHGKRSEESTPRGRMGTRKAVRDTPREGKNMPRWGKDLSNVEEEPLREGREERPCDLRHFYQSSSVDPRFEPQAFSSPFVDTLDPQTSFVETNYGNEVDRNSSLTSPTLDREVPEKEVSYESRVSNAKAKHSHDDDDDDEHHHNKNSNKISQPKKNKIKRV